MGNPELSLTVETLQYISRTLTLALPSLSINGLDASPALVAYPVPNAATEIEIDENDTSYEPYDPRLATRLRMLHASLEAEITHVAELRREAPGAAARGFVEKLRDEIDGGEQEVEETRLRLAQEVGSRLFDELKVSEMERGGLDQGWGNAFGALEGLRGVTEAVAKLERAERALKEVVGR